MCSGKISVEFHNKQVQYITKNQLIVFNPRQVHVCKNTDIKSYDYFTFHFDKKWLKNLHTELYFDENIINDKYYYKKFVNIAKNAMEDNNYNVTIELKKLMKRILKEFAKNKVIQNNNLILEKINKFILKNIDEQITLEDISYEIGYSKEHIIRIFKKEFGLSPHAYLMNEKVNKVKNILQISKNKNLSQVALDIGFYDQSHLTRYFKKSFAITPSDYKIK